MTKLLFAKLPIYIFTLLLGTLILVGCGGSESIEPPATEDGEQNSEDDNITPENPDSGDSNSSFVIASRQPAENATNRSLLSDITMVFSKPLVAASVSAQSFDLKAGTDDISFSITYEEGQRDLRITPINRLEPDTVYEITVLNDVMSEDGEQLTNQIWRFTTAGNIGNTPQSTIDSCMTDEDLNMLDAVNIARSSQRDCGLDNYQAVSHLSWNCLVKAAALRHSTDMATVNFFSHDGSDASTMRERINDTGYSWSSIAENIAAGYSSVDSVLAGWLDSPGHCQNIMSSSVTEMGSALVIADPGTTDYTTYWTQNFARPSN